MSKVTVYRWKKLDMKIGEGRLTGYYASLQSIKEFGGIALEETGIEIEETMLDGNRMYKPKEE